ncbi:MAG: M20/M25/M40 family metallo-hydrolase [Anaerolineae bacterium]
MEEHAGLLAADSVLVSDTAFLAEGKPMLVYGLRGLTYMEILVDGPHHDLHSGAYGGTVYNPAQVLAEIIAKLHNDDATVAIPGFYDRVRELSETDREAAAQVDYPVTQWQQETGMDKPWGEAGYSLIERRGGRPTCEVNGIWGGYSGEGGKTIIPAHAGAKISMRLVPDQDPDEIAQLFADFIPTIAPEHVRVTVNKLSGGWPSITPIDSPEMKAAAAALQAVWGVPPVFSREGGSIPVISTFQKVLGASAVLMGFGLPGSKMHAPNEHFKEDHYYKAIEAIIHYYHNLAG